MKHLDPMKEINNDIYLNDVALKMRYSLLKLNKKNERTKTETGTHWLKFKPYPVVDDDIKHNYIVQGNSTVNNINRKNTEVFNQIHKTELKKKLNSINQTAALSYELTGDRNRRLYHDKIQTSVYFHSNPYSKSGNNTLRIYQKKSLKNQFINSIPFVTNKNDVHEKRKKVIYDIGPINTKTERGSCIFPKLNSSLTTFENTFNENHKNQETTKNYVKEKTIDKIITDSNNNLNDKKFNIRIIKAKGEPHKIKLKELANDLLINEGDSFRMKTNLNRMMFSKSITIYDPHAKKNKPTHKKIQTKSPQKKYLKDIKYLDEDVVKKGAFPKRFYLMNYTYDNGAEEIKKNNNKMDIIQDDITSKFNDIKQLVSTSIDETYQTLEK